MTPYTNAFLHGAGARNILLQNACPLDATDHLGISYDDVVQVLEDEGVAKFEVSWNELLDTIRTNMGL